MLPDAEHGDDEGSPLPQAPPKRLVEDEDVEANSPRVVHLGDSVARETDDETFEDDERENARSPHGVVPESDVEQYANNEVVVERDDGNPASSASASVADEEGNDDERLESVRWVKKSSSHVRSLADIHSSVHFPPEESAPWYMKLKAFSGTGIMIGVGYMDPGNWATDVAGGARFGYDLMFVVVSASIIAMFLQYLALKLGVATGRDLAMACRDAFHPKVVVGLWIIAEIAIAATDLAEVLGAAVALFLLAGGMIPMYGCVLITVIDVFFILILQQNRIRLMEALVLVLTGTIMVCLSYIVGVVQPNWGEVFRGVLPSARIFADPDELFVAISIVGATVMPHNLFLHSSLVQTRKYSRTLRGKRTAIKFATIDSTLSLVVSMIINSFILILAAGAFHSREDLRESVGDITDAYELLAPVLGAGAASTLFAVALLAAGQQASLTGTLAGQIVMEGYVDLHVAPWKRRFATRVVALVPAVVVTAIDGGNVGKLLVLSQVILSIALPFVTFPLVYFTSDRRKMSKHFVNSKPLALLCTVLVSIMAALNIYILASPSTWEFSGRRRRI